MELTMRIMDAMALHTEACEREVAIRGRKAHDYSTDENVFANFEVVPAICAVFQDAGIPIQIETPEGYCLLMVILKLARIQNLLHRDEALNEGIGDSVMDARVYLEILREMLIARDRAKNNPDPELLENVRALAG